METLRGTIVKFRWRSDTSAWKIAELQPEGKDQPIVIMVGNIDSSNLDMSVTASGKMVMNKQYGRQFEVSRCLRNQEEDLKATGSWLKRQTGVGPKLAQAIIDRFGDGLRKVIEDDWFRLCKVKRVSKLMAADIHETWTDNVMTREIQLLLLQGGVSASDRSVRKVIKKFGEDAIARIRDNPYRLTEIAGIGFRTADAMARNLGWTPQRPERVEAALAHLLQEAADDGHTYLHRGDLVGKVRELASVEVEGEVELLPVKDAEEAIDRVIGRKGILQETLTVNGQEHKMCYLPKYKELEVTAARRIAELQRMPQAPPYNIGKILKTVGDKLGMELSAQQKDGVIQALAHNCSVITGLPGTGKTSCVRALIQTAREMRLRVMVCAPTGRAAQRLQEVSGFSAKTIHRTLGYIPNKEAFTYDGRLTLPCDILIVDEASMLDLELMVAVLKAVPDTCSVVWIGDVNQLPSIGAGMVLRDMITSGRVHVTVLDKIFRQAEGSLIIQNAHRIHRGEHPTFPIKGSKADSYLIPVPKSTTGNKTDDIEFVKTKLKEIYARLQKVHGLDPIRDIQLLTPMRIGPAGYLAFNPIIQEIVNPSSEKIEVGGQCFRMNDRVMQTVNDYDMDVFNGDVGFIKSVDRVGRTLEIEFLGQTIDYPFSNASNLVLSYASSVHKAQGSEFPVTILVLLSHHYVMLDRNIIYTANTRARKMAIYLSSHAAIDIAVKTQKVLKRNSLLAERLKKAIPKID